MLYGESMTASNESLHAQIGDKVRIKSGLFTGQRGVIAVINDEELTVDLASGEHIQLAEGELTNYSLAARRAWQKMPKQAGRPKTSRKKLVSLRIDAELWERIGQAVTAGVIRSREEAINLWLSERLGILFADSRIQELRSSYDASVDEHDQLVEGSQGNDELDKENR